jgi:hypothetical protein
VSRGDTLHGTLIILYVATIRVAERQKVTIMKFQYWSSKRGKRTVSKFKLARILNCPVKIAKARKINGEI